MPRTTSRVSARPLDDSRKSPIASAPFPAADAAPFWRSVGFAGVARGGGIEARREHLPRALGVEPVPYFAYSGRGRAVDVVGRPHA